MAGGVSSRVVVACTRVSGRPRHMHGQHNGKVPCSHAMCACRAATATWSHARRGHHLAHGHACCMLPRPHGPGLPLLSPPYAPPTPALPLARHPVALHHEAGSRLHRPQPQPRTPQAPPRPPALPPCTPPSWLLSRPPPCAPSDSQHPHAPPQSLVCCRLPGLELAAAIGRVPRTGAPQCPPCHLPTQCPPLLLLQF